ncbi:uncharacterized protein LOC130821331 isoform X2 [Amaranthus tricolor]|nr:uncharacterized protein LOC130821331 isoform X2 [Amaranthus tricolor]
MAVDEEQQHAVMPVDDSRAVFIDTDLDTHFAVVVSPSSSIYSLKQQIATVHFKYFPDCGTVTIKSLLVKLQQNYYHLPDNMLLKAAFHGVSDSWLLFADIWAPVELRDPNFLKQLEPSSPLHYELRRSKSPSLPLAPSEKNFKNMEKSYNQGDGKCEVDNDKSNRKSIEISRCNQNTSDSPKTNLLDEQEICDGTVPGIGEVSGSKHLDVCEGHHDTSAAQACSMPLKDGDNIEGETESGNHLEAGHRSKKKKNKRKRNTDDVDDKKKKNKNKVKSSSAGDQDFSGKMSVDDRKANDTSDVRRELSQPVGISTPEESVEITSRKLKRSQNKKAVPTKDSSVSPMEEQPDEQIGERAASRSMIQSDKSKKMKQKRQPVAAQEPDSLLVQHHSIEGTTETNEKGEQADDTLTNRKAKDTKLMLKNKSKIRKTNLNDGECGKTVDLSPSHLNNVPELSQHESFDLADREKEDVAPLKSDNTTEKRTKAKSFSVDTQDIMHTHGELSNQDDIGRPDESVDTMSGKVKKSSRNKKGVRVKDPPESAVKEQQNEENKEMDDPNAEDINMIRECFVPDDESVMSRKVKKSSRKKKAVPVKDPPESTVKEQQNEENKEMDDPNAKDINMTREFFVPDDESVMSRKVKKSSRNKKVVPVKDPLESTVKEQQNEENKEMDDPNAEDINMIRKFFVPDDESLMSRKVKKSSRNKKAVPVKDPPESTVKAQQNEENKAMDDPNAVDMIREFFVPDDESVLSRKVKKSSRNKKAVPVNDLPESTVKAQQNEENKEMDDPKAEDINRIRKFFVPDDESVLSRKVKKISRNKKAVPVKDPPESTVKEQQNEENKEMDDPNAKDINMQRELFCQDDIGRPKESVDSMSEKVKKSSRNIKVVPLKDPPESTVKEQQNEEIKEVDAAIIMIQSDKLNERSQKKQLTPVKDSSSLLSSQHSDETIMEMDATKSVGQADEILTKGDTLDTPLKSKNTAKKRKTNGNEGKCRNNVAAVSISQQKNVFELSQQNPDNLIEKEKEIEEDVTSLKSENTATRRKNVKAKGRDAEKAGLSSLRQSDDLNTDQESREKDLPISVIQSDLPEKIPVKDSSSSLFNQHTDETMMKMDATKSVEQADEVLIDCDTLDDPLKSKNTAKKRKTNGDDGKCRETAAAVSMSHENNVSQLSQHNPVNLAEKEKEKENEKEIEEDVTSLKSENAAKRRINVKAKGSGSENEGLSSLRHENNVSESDLRSLPVNLLSDGSTIKMNAPERVEQADDILTNCDVEGENQEKVILGDEHDGKLIGTIPSEMSSDVADLRDLEKPRASKKKAKRFDQASSVDTSSDGNLVELKIKGGSAIINELDNNGSRSSVLNTTVPLANAVDNRKEAGVSCRSKVSEENLTMNVEASEVVENAANHLTDTKISDFQNLEESTQSEHHRAEFNQDVHSQVDAGSDEARLVEKPEAGKQKAKKLDQPSSIDTSSTGQNLVGSRKSRGSARTSEIQAPIAGQKHDKSVPPRGIKKSTTPKKATETLSHPSETPRKTNVSFKGEDDGSESADASSKSSVRKVLQFHHKEKAKQPPKKLEEDNYGLRRSSRLGAKESTNTPAQKKGLLSSGRAIFEDGTSSSSEDETDASSSSTTIAPDPSSSSDYSDGETKDSPKTVQKCKTISFGRDLASIIRGSNRFKKAKMMASQSQDDSQPIEFVPDSLPNM